MHPKKLAQLDAWLASPLQRVAVLRGAVGSGKSTALRVLCAARRMPFVEFVNQSLSFAADRKPFLLASFIDFLQLKSRAHSPSPLDLFALENFIQTALRSGKTSPSCNPPMALYAIDADFPPVYNDDAAKFRFWRLQKELVHVINSTDPCCCPFKIVFVVANSFATSNDYFEYFCAEFRTSPHVFELEFNTFAKSFCKKALMQTSSVACRKLQLGPPTAALIDAIVEVCAGDVRYGINLLELTVRSSGAASFCASTAASLGRVFARDGSLDIFATLGKIFYRKRESPVSRIVDACGGEATAAAAGQAASTVNNFVEQNVFEFYNDIEPLYETLELLSLANAPPNRLFFVTHAHNWLALLPAHFLQNVCSDVQTQNTFRAFKRPQFSDADFGSSRVSFPQHSFSSARNK